MAQDGAGGSRMAQAAREAAGASEGISGDEGGNGGPVQYYTVHREGPEDFADAPSPGCGDVGSVYAGPRITIFDDTPEAMVKKAEQQTEAAFHIARARYAVALEEGEDLASSAAPGSVEGRRLRERVAAYCLASALAGADGSSIIQAARFLLGDGVEKR